MEAASSGISAIGIDWKALLFQVLNFVILLWVLKRFAYRPIVRLLEARRQRIEESLKTADAIDAEKASFTAARARRLGKVEQEAEAILSRSQQAGAEVLQSAQARGREVAEKMRADAAASLEQERLRLAEGLKAETLQLVRRAAERLLREKFDSEADAQLIRRALNEVETP